MSARKTDTVALRKRMIECGYKSAIDLHRASSISRTTIGNILAGKAQPSATIMEKLMTVLEIAPEEAGKVFFSSDLRGA